MVTLTQAGGAKPPISIITGTGSYTVPTGYWGILTMNTASAASAGVAIVNLTTSGPTQGSAGNACANTTSQIIKEGTTISTALSNPSGSSALVFGAGERQTSGSAIININGAPACISYSNAAAAGFFFSGAAGSMKTYHTGAVAWTLALYEN